MCCVKRALTAELVMEAVAAVHLKVSAVRGCVRTHTVHFLGLHSFCMHVCMYVCDPVRHENHV